MSEMEKLAAQLKQQQDDEQSARAKAEVEQGLWISSLHELFKKLETWLQPLVSNRTAKVVRDWVTISEDPNPAAKTYEAPTMAVIINGKTVEIKPIGRYVVGAQGLVEFGSQVQSWKLVRHVNDGVESWKIRYVYMRQAHQPHDLTSDTFAEAIGKYLQGHTI